MSESEADPLIEAHRLYRLYGRGEALVRALDGVDLSIHDGEFVAIMGSSGSGKSTCMNILGCLDTPTSGSYRFKGVEVASLSRDQLALLRRHYIGFVFQSFNLLPRTTALENVELPLVYLGLPTRRRRTLAYAALEQVGLADRFRHTPGELSGGQQQRVAIARALVTRPAVLLADEPTGNLDTHTSHQIMETLSELNAQGLTIVMVTHELEVARFAQRGLQFRDGRLVRDAPVEEWVA